MIACPLRLQWVDLLKLNWVISFFWSHARCSPELLKHKPLLPYWNSMLKIFNRWVTIGLTDLTFPSTSWHTSALTFVVDFCPLDEFLKFGHRIVQFKRRGDILNVWFLCWQIHSLVCCYAVLSRFSHVRPFATLRTAGLLCPREFFRQEYWSGLPFPPPQGIPDAGIGPTSLMSPVLAGGFFTTSATREGCLFPAPKDCVF